MATRTFRLLVRAFPKHLRDRIGRPLVQTLLSDCKSGGRFSLARFIAGAWDVVRAGLAARLARPSSPPEPRRGWRGIVEDLHQVRRSLARRKAFAVTVVLTLSIGIAVSATIFAVISTVFVRDLPYRDPSRLGFMWTRLAWIGVPRAWVAGPHIDLLAREAKTIESIVPIRANSGSVQINNRPEVVVAGFTHAPIFDVLGVRPMLGRGFVQADEPLNVAILSHHTWTNTFGGNPNVVGTSFEFGSDRMEVIGVMPEDFRFVVHSSLGEPRTVDIWFPTRWPLATMSDTAFGFAALVRVRPGMSLEQAQLELETIGRQLDAKRFKSRGFGWDLVGVQTDLTRSAWAPMRLLGIAASLLLLVMAANMAGLMLTRQAARQREFAVRTALGAPRSSLARLVLLESITLWVIAAGVGLGLTATALPVIAASTSLPLPRLQEVRLDWTISGVVMAASILGGLIFGLLPAVRATRRVSGASMQEVGRGNSARATTARSALVVAEVAVAVALVAGGTMLLRSYASLRHTDPGFRPEGVMLAYLPLDTAKYPQEAQAVSLFSGLLTRIQTMPGVLAVGGTTSRPLGGDTDQAPALPEGWTPPEGGESLMSDLIRVTPGYFSAMGIQVLEGRDFAWTDAANGQPVVVVDERFAREAWPNQPALGRRVSLSRSDKIDPVVVGVVRHARQYRYDADDRPQLFRPYAQDTTSFLTLAVRTSGDPEAIMPALRRVVGEADARLPVARVTTMSDVVDLALLDRVIQLTLVATFAISAIFLAALGVFSVLSAMVGDRAREIGIRMALGADAGNVRRLVVRRTAWLTGAGLVVGLIATLAASRILEPLLFQISAHDGTSLAWTTALVLAAALVATYVPVRRATKIDPVTALKRD
jgi:putative ABC transport system permease protein